MLILFIILNLASPIHATGLNDTGITTCSNETQNGLTCPVSGFPGQDGDFVAPFNFTKIDANGIAMPVTATNHSCVKDNVTGLMWEVKTDDGGLQDKDNTYTFAGAASFASQVNATNLCGHNDWRVPNPQELAGIADDLIAYPGPALDLDFFFNTVSNYFWTATPYAGDSSDGWFVHSGYGSYVWVDYRSTSYSVRLVRGAIAGGAFTDNGDGTITDAITGLMWAKCSQGQTGTDCSGSASYLTWQQALQAADGLTLAGHDDWRLPNVKELQSLADYTKYNPAINSMYFPNTPGSWFWTASPYFNCVNCSWFVSFADGSVGSYVRANDLFVRCVRAGHSDFFSFSLSINRLGVGSGTVVSNPTGINCGTVCSANFSGQNTPISVTLTATPAAGSTFGGWSSNCGGSTGSPTVNMTADTTCTATFNLIPIPKPIATTSAATSLTQTSATLNGTVISSGATATVSFDFGTTTSYGTSIAATPSSVYSATAVAVSANKTGLTCGTVYHFRAKAVNSAGTGYGVDKTFTVACPITTYTVTASANPVAGGSFTPEIAQTVNAGTTTSFTVTANEGYVTNTAVTGTCPPGTWNSGSTSSPNVWTTGTISQSCTVIFGFTAVNSWLAPPNQTVIPAYAFTLDVTVKSTSVKVGQYTFVVTFDPNQLRLDTTYTDATGLCINGVCPGSNALANRFIPVINNDTITLNGNDPIGTGPGNDLQLLVIHFKSRYILDAPSFATSVALQTNLLTTTDGDNIGTVARGATVNVTTGLCGDATGDTLVNIVDALGISRKLVGMPPPPTVDTVLADVNEDGRLSIVDALQIARYSVGLVNPPEVCKIGQAF